MTAGLRAPASKTATARILGLGRRERGCGAGECQLGACCVAHVSTASHLHGYSRDTASISPLKSARAPSIAATAGELRVRPYRTDGNRRTWVFPCCGWRFPGPLSAGQQTASAMLQRCRGSNFCRGLHAAVQPAFAPWTPGRPLLFSWRSIPVCLLSDCLSCFYFATYNTWSLASHCNHTNLAAKGSEDALCSGTLAAQHHLLYFLSVVHGDQICWPGDAMSKFSTYQMPNLREARSIVKACAYSLVRSREWGDGSL